MYYTRNVPVADDHEEELENVIAALENYDRITHIHLNKLSGSTLRRFVAMMLEPFVTLTHLILQSNETMAPVLPEAFLGGSAPRLRFFTLVGIAFPSLPRLFQLYPATLSISPLRKFRLLGTFPPRQWPLTWPRCPISRPLSLNSAPLDPVQTNQVHLHSRVLCSPLLPTSHSGASASTWKTSSLDSISPLPSAR
jgi:hypothetical protein